LDHDFTRSFDFATNVAYNNDIGFIINVNVKEINNQIKINDAYATLLIKMSQKGIANQDLRVVRTRKMLRDAMIALAIQKGFSSITVNDIVELAMVNRATFYRHYQDKYDLVESYLDELYAELNAAPVPAPSPGEPNPGLVKLFEHIRDNAPFYRAMLGPHGYSGFGERIRRLTEATLRARWQAVPQAAGRTQVPAPMLLSYLSHASYGALVWWLEGGLNHSPEQMARWLHQLTLAAFQAG
jgi:AcrR family transcriptional regulator